MRERVATVMAEGPLVLLLVTLPLAAWSGLWDQFVTVKWYLLSLVAALWLLAETWGMGSRGWPSALREHPWLSATVAGLAAASTLRSGAAAAVGPLAVRLAVAVLALCSFWYFRRQGLGLRTVRACTAAALVPVLAIGLAQAAGLDPLRELVAADARGATFGNANIAAQWTGLAVLVLVAAPPRRRRWAALAQAGLLAATGAWLALLWCRSVLLALALALPAMWMARRPRGRSAWVAAAVMGAAVAAGGLALQTESARIRLAVWADTLRLVADHPAGVGAGRFEDAVRPYQADGRSAPEEGRAYRTPHNEYLRVAAEDGLPLLAAAMAALAVLALRLWRRFAPLAERPPAAVLLTGAAVFLAVEGALQFPLALATGAGLSAVLLGLALAADEGGSAEAATRPARAAWPALAVVAAAFLVWATARQVASELLFLRAPRDLAAQQRACALDPRNLPACVTAAWLRGAGGDGPGARAELADVLRRAPHYPPALKLLAEQALGSGDRRAGCAHARAYDRLFRGRSSLHRAVEELCGPTPGP